MSATHRISDRIRVGAVRYLNTKPLVHGLAWLAPQADIMYDLPSRLADRLASGDLDVALIPSFECFAHPEYTILSDACIGCRGPVMSVKLYCRVPVDEIRTLALDEGSRTSAALAQILLAQRFDLRPKLTPLPMGASMDDSLADAVLLIGDRCITTPQQSLAEVWDLGEQWCRLMRLPFVFAMWTARPGVEVNGLEDALGAARDEGLQHLPEIAAAQAHHVGLTEQECLCYLRDNLHFHLGPQEQQGLLSYYRQAVRLGLATAGWDLKIHDCQTTG